MRKQDVYVCIIIYIATIPAKTNNTRSIIGINSCIYKCFIQNIVVHARMWCNRRGISGDVFVSDWSRSPSEYSRSCSLRAMPLVYCLQSLLTAYARIVFEYNKPISSVTNNLLNCHYNAL